MKICTHDAANARACKSKIDPAASKKVDQQVADCLIDCIEAKRINASSGK